MRILIRVYTICHSICIFWKSFSRDKIFNLNLRLITANIFDVLNILLLYLPCWFHFVSLSLSVWASAFSCWLCFCTYLVDFTLCFFNSVYFSEPQPSVVGYVSIPTLLISLCVSLTFCIFLWASAFSCWLCFCNYLVDFTLCFLNSVYFSEPQPSVVSYVSIPTLLISLCVSLTLHLFLWASAFSCWLCFCTYLVDFTLCFFNSVYFSEPQPSVVGYVSIPNLLISLCVSLTFHLFLWAFSCWLCFCTYLVDFTLCFFNSVYFSEPQPSVAGYVSIPNLLLSLCVSLTFRLFLWAFSFWLCFCTYLVDFTLCFFNSIYFSEPQPSVVGYVSIPTLLISLFVSLTLRLFLWALAFSCWLCFCTYLVDFTLCFFNSVYFSEPQPSVFGHVSVPTLLISLCVSLTFRLFLWASAFSFWLCFWPTLFISLCVSFIFRLFLWASAFNFWLCFYTYLAAFTLCFFNFPSISLSLSLQLLVIFLYLPWWFHSVFL